MPSCLFACISDIAGDVIRAPIASLMAASFFFAALPAAAQITVRDPAASAAEEMLRALADGRFEYVGGRVAPAAAGQMNAARLEAIWRQLEAQVGKLDTFTHAGIETQDTLHHVRLAARFERAALTVRFVLTPGLELTGLWLDPPRPPPSSPPAYADTTAFSEEPVTIGEAPWALPGVFALPAGDARVPAVVLVHGSGPHDRDETVGPNRPFRDLAWGLATRGVAVLRYDKRTYVHGARMGAEITVEQEVIEDALTALDVARAHPRVDPDRVFLLGHSLGALLAPVIARRDGRAAGVALLAAPARPPIETLYAQLDYLASLPMNASPAAAGQIAELRAAVDRLASGTVPDTMTILGATPAYLRDLSRYDAVRTALSLDLPILLLQGGRDYQVTPGDDFRRWRETFDDRPNATLIEFPSLNHLFIPGEGVPTPQEYGTPGHVDPEVIESLARFLARSSDLR